MIALMALVMLLLDDVAIGAAVMFVALVLLLVMRFVAVAVGGEVRMTFWPRMLSLGLVLACITLSFASLYRVQSREEPGGFGESALHHPLSSLNALYLAMGTFSTVGAGRIAPVSATAKAEQMVQEAIDVLLLMMSSSILMPPGKPRKGRSEQDPLL